MLLIVLLAALVLAARAGGAEPPAQLFVMAYDTTPGAVAETDIDLVLAAPASAVSVVVPAGYRLDAAAPAGAAVGTAILRTAPGRAATVTLRADEPGTHAAVWVGGLLTVLVDAVSGGGLQLTFRPPVGAVNVDLDLDGVLTNPPAPGHATWCAVVTTGGGTVEARSVVGIPQTLGFRARFAGRLVLRGRLLSAGAPRRAVDVHFAIATNDDLSDARGRHILVHAVGSAPSNGTAPDADRLRQLLRRPVPRLRRAIDHPAARRTRVADSPEALKRPGTGVRLWCDDPPKHSPNRASVAFMFVPLSTEEEAAR